MQTASTLQRSMPILAAALGQKFGVEVLFSGTEMRTDGAKIWAPAIDAGPEIQSVIKGVICHEAGHIRFSDWRTISAAGTNPLRRHIFNGIEDVRIEKALSAEWPGTPQMMEAPLRWLIDNGKMAPVQADDHPGSILDGFTLYHLRRYVLNQTCLDSLARQAEAVTIRTFPKGAIVRLKMLLQQASTLSSSAEALQLADAILAMLDEEANKEPPPSAGDDDNDQADGDDNGDGVNQSPTCAADAQSASDGQQSGSNGENDDQTGGQNQPASSTISNAPAADGRQALQAALNADDGAWTSHDPFAAAQEAVTGVAKAAPQSQRLTTMARPIPCPPGTNTNVLKTARDHSGKLSTCLRGLVQAARRDDVSARRNGARLLGRRLHLTAVGSSSVFERRDEQNRPNTALHILLDRSFSMAKAVHAGKTSKLETALESALALALALESISGVNLAITAFPGFIGEQPLASDHPGVHELLRHGERVAGGICRYGLPAKGGTPMAEALWFAAAKLLTATPEPRKVIVAVSDGDPDNIDQTLDIVSRCNASGIETIGIRIGHDGARLFPVSASISDAGELKTALFDLAKSLLTS